MKSPYFEKIREISSKSDMKTCVEEVKRVAAESLKPAKSGIQMVKIFQTQDNRDFVRESAKI